MNDQKNFNQPQGNRRWVWVAVIGLWVTGCVILAVGGGWWWGQRSADTRQDEAIDVATEATPAAEIILSTPEPESAATLAPTDTPAPQPTATPTATSGPSLGDQLVLPTATSTPIPEGVIVFLSSRDHDPQSKWSTYLELYVMKPDGSQQTRIGTVSQYQDGFLPSYLTPYKKSNKILINNDTYNGGPILDLVSGDFVGSDHVGNEYLRGIYPSWSQDGRVVFWDSTDDQPRTKIYYQDNIEEDAKPLVPLSENGSVSDRWPAWSPDDNWIAFSRDDAQQDNGVWIVKPDGSDLHQIIAMDFTRIIEWSPDGSKLAFQGGDHTKLDIWVADADGSNQKQLSFFPYGFDTYDTRLSWSPDSKRIIFQIGEISSYKGQLYIVDADGNSEPRQLTFEGQTNRSPIWVPISMDEILANAPTPTPPTATPKPGSVAPPSPSSCPAEGAQISLPRTGTRFNTRYNYIIGTANINRFHHWKLEYSTNPDGGWQYLLERDYAVNNDKLAMIDAKTIPRGPYGLRLTVVDETGNYPEPCVVWFTNGY